jgi:hypothetical protein
MPLASKLRTKNVKIKHKGPLWKGPTEDGITYSLLSRFLVCRERFRLLAVEGLRATPEFSNRMEYGQMWHACEEAFAVGGNPIVDNPVANPPWHQTLKKYCQQLCNQHRTQQEQIQHWYNVCKTQFPIYIKYWANHKDVKQRTPLLQEHVFSVPYKLPSGRTVLLRGKWDSVDLIGPKSKGRVFLQENKTKGDIDQLKIATQLRDDLQSMLYYLALDYYYREYAKAGDKLFPNDYGPPAGIRYNVVRRPLSGGKHSIRQKQGEESEAFYERLGGLIAEEPEHYFVRWNVDIALSDLKRFEQRFFIPVMEQLCDWWEFMQLCEFSPWDYVNHEIGCGDCGVDTRYLHWQHPHGVYNVLNEGGTTELDEYLATGSILGLAKTDSLFKELE